ncbi:ribosome maturation factor RimM [Buchnera aphidicola (Aphis gossypii)]|uniref:Ribosome maturation factor RimM n=1 Tax=Buchnera aphidicola (Aphis gossypii) TaxID=98785 RepID=A0A5J6ZDX2_9GAMM|nr:ribosome maturation factor RimM [Buchnera aphidicola (Aphis gossypii)]
MNIKLDKLINPILVGKIGRVYGILGWINFFSFTEDKEKIFSYLPWFILKNKKWETIQLKSWKKYNNRFIIQINNVIDRSVASAWTNTDIFIDRVQLPKLKKNEYYWDDIIKCKVFSVKNKYLGIVIDLISNKYNDTILVKNKLKRNNKTIMIPFITEKVVKYIDIKNKIITVQWN